MELGMPGVEERGTPFEAPIVRAKLFQHGGSQAVRLPKAFRFEGAEVTVRREGEAVILEPVRTRRVRTDEEMAAFWAEIDANGGADFPDREQPPMQERDLDW
jgi:antitoxin VapB